MDSSRGAELRDRRFDPDPLGDPTAHKGERQRGRSLGFQDIQIRGGGGGGGGPGEYGSHGEFFLAYLPDHLGSTRAVVDMWGNLVETREYDPFGRTTRHTGDFELKHRFTGQPESGAAGPALYDYGARLYEPSWGRFLTPDSYVEGFDAQGLNRYAYVRNRPTSLVDPTGNFGDGGGLGGVSAGASLAGGGAAWSGGAESGGRSGRGDGPPLGCHLDFVLYVNHLDLSHLDPLVQLARTFAQLASSFAERGSGKSVLDDLVRLAQLARGLVEFRKVAGAQSQGAQGQASSEPLERVKVTTISGPNEIYVDFPARDRVEVVIGSTGQPFPRPPLVRVEVGIPGESPVAIEDALTTTGSIPPGTVRKAVFDIPGSQRLRALIQVTNEANVTVQIFTLPPGPGQPPVMRPPRPRFP